MLPRVIFALHGDHAPAIPGTWCRIPLCCSQPLPQRDQRPYTLARFLARQHRIHIHRRIRIDVCAPAFLHPLHGVFHHDLPQLARVLRRETHECDLEGHARRGEGGGAEDERESAAAAAAQGEEQVLWRWLR